MNIKKIILLSLAAMSVMGAFTACSDNKVVGADEQSNTVAERSSSSVESGSSNSSISIKIIEDRIKAISKPNLAAAVIVSNEKVIEDTINAHETFEKVIQSIIDDDSYKVTIADSAEWTKFEGADGSIGYWNWRTEEVNAMVDENGVVHGPLWHRVEVYPSEGSVSKVIQCTSSNSWYSCSGYGTQADDIRHWMRLESTDSVVLEQFRQDCTSENGAIYEGASHGTYGELAFSCPVIDCYVYKSPGDTTLVDRDPYWKKYASHIVDGCVSPDNLD